MFNSNGKNISKQYSPKHKGNGVAEALCITNQLCNIEWKTVNNGMPNASDSNTIAEGTTVKGMPYSSASMEDGYIGIGISIYTFMSAVHNPRSVLYTEMSKGYTGYAYYGTICTSLICAAWGLPCLITTVAFPKWSEVEQVAFADLEIGDMILSLTEGHAKIISGVVRDSNGDITSIRTSESKYNDCITNNYQTYSAFTTAHSTYLGYRYKHIDSVDSYEPVPFIRFFDEPYLDAVFPDIMTGFGDKVTRKKGTDVRINVLNTEGYSSIQIYKNNELIETKYTLVDFTISSPGIGAYEVRLVGEKKTSSTYFDIVDCYIDIDGTDLTFSTTYEALAIGGIPAYTTDASGKATSWNNPKRNRILTEEENVAKEIDITEFANDSDCQGGIRLYVKGIYGSVSFEKLYS